MPESVHVVEAKWREAIALSLEEQVRAINDWLEHTLDISELFEQREDLEFVTELRSLTGVVRTKRDDIQREAEMLVAKLADRKDAS